MRKQKGITLIALVITIIVMLILVGVAVNVAISEGGIISKAKEAVSEMTAAQIRDKAEAIKAELIIDMEAGNSIIVATQEFKTKLETQLNGEIKGNKVVVQDKEGKQYDIVIKNSDLELEVKEHNDYVNINSIITPNITWETTGEGDITIGAKVDMDLVANISKTDYALSKIKEVINATTYEEKTNVVLEYLSNNPASQIMTVTFAEPTNNNNTKIETLDDFFLLQANAMLESYGQEPCKTLDECTTNQAVRTFLRLGPDDELTKGQLYNYFINGNISQELTEKQIIESFYNAIVGAQIDTNEYAKEYEYATKNLTIGLKKGNNIQTKEIAYLAEGNEYSFEITENGEYEISIINKTAEEDILIQEEKIVVNNILGAENAISRDDATGIWTTDGNGTIAKYLGAETNVTIPAYIGAEKITKIGQGWTTYEARQTMKSVKIPNTVTTIDFRAFENLYALTNVEIPNSVTSIGDRAFDDCGSLTEITIPNSVTSIGNSAFIHCSSLTEITIPNSVTSIGDSAFSDCTGLTEITIPNSVTSIGGSAFSGCTALTSITIPNSVTSLGVSTFSGCTNLTDITLPDSITSLNSTFIGCTSLKEVIIPSTVKSLQVTFMGCTGLTNFVIPETIEVIGVDAFRECKNLVSVTIPNTVNSIEARAFYGCENLDNVIIPDTVNSIENYTFSGCDSLTNITIPNSVNSIGKEAFWDCDSLTSITIPNSVISISNDAFERCINLTNIYLEAGSTLTIPEKQPWGAPNATVTKLTE